MEVRWEGGDNFSAARYEIKLDDDEFYGLGSAEVESLYDLSEGAHSLRIRAYDGANNSIEKTISFNIDLTPPIELSLRLKGREKKTFSAARRTSTCITR